MIRTSVYFQFWKHIGVFLVLSFSLPLLFIALITLPMPANAQSTDIQMLPPIGCPTTSWGILAWNSANPLGCISGFTSTPAGAVTANSFNSPSFTGGTFSGTTVTASTSVTIGGSTATNTTVNAANTLATLLSECGAAGGGTVSIDSNGKLFCGQTQIASAPAPTPIPTPDPTPTPVASCTAGQTVTNQSCSANHPSNPAVAPWPGIQQVIATTSCPNGSTGTPTVTTSAGACSPSPTSQEVYVSQSNLQSGAVAWGNSLSTGYIQSDIASCLTTPSGDLCGTWACTGGTGWASSTHSWIPGGTLGGGGAWSCGP